MNFKTISILFCLLMFGQNFYAVKKDGNKNNWRTDAPLKGWKYVGVEILEQANGICEMGCGQTKIRYLHTVSHRDFEDLHVGCICAGYLTNDSKTPKDRENAAITTAKKIKYEREAIECWSDINKWDKQDENNYSKYKQGRGIKIFKEDNGWKYTFINSNIISERSYDTAQEAAKAFSDNYKCFII